MTTLEDLLENYDGSLLSDSDTVARMRAELQELRHKAWAYDNLKKIQAHPPVVQVWNPSPAIIASASAAPHNPSEGWGTDSDRRYVYIPGTSG